MAQPKLHLKKVTVSLSDDEAEFLIAEATRRSVIKSTIVREALQLYRDQFAQKIGEQNKMSEQELQGSYSLTVTDKLLEEIVQIVAESTLKQCDGNPLKFNNGLIKQELLNWLYPALSRQIN